MELLTTLTIKSPAVKSELYYQGTNILAYKFYHNNALLFEGNDFKPSPLNNIDDLEPALDILGFLTVKPGDTDPEYFENYTQDQLSFCNSFECEQISVLISDLSDKSSEYYKSAKKQVKFKIH